MAHTADPQQRDDTSRAVVRLAVLGFGLVVALSAGAAWDHWRQLKAGAQVSLRAYASTYADHFGQHLTDDAERMRGVAAILREAPAARRHALLERELRAWSESRGLMLLDAGHRPLMVAGEALGSATADPALPAATRRAWSDCAAADCLLPPLPDPMRPGRRISGQLHRLASPIDGAAWLLQLRADDPDRLLAGVRDAMPEARLLVLRKADGLPQQVFPSEAFASGHPQAESVLGWAMHGGADAGRAGPDGMIGAAVAVPGAPYMVIAMLPRQAMLGRWAADLLPLAGLLALGAALGAALLAAGRRRMAAAEASRRAALDGLRRASDFQTFRARANELMSRAHDEAELVGALCEAAIGHAGIRLAWVGRARDDHGVDVLAAAGATSYLDGLAISVDAGSPDGKGPFGKTWRSSAPHFNDDWSEAPDPWGQRASRAGLRASAALPIRRHGRQDAVLSLYWGVAIEFDQDFRDLLREAGADIGRGLERLDLLAAQREARRAQERQGELMRTVFSQIDVLIAARDELELLETACTRLLEGGLFVSAWIGRPGPSGAVDVVAAPGETRALLERHPVDIVAAPDCAVARTWTSGAKAIEVDPASPLIVPWLDYAMGSSTPEAITLPIRRSGADWAVLVLVAHEGADLDEIVQDTLLRTAELIGQALTEADLKRLLKERESEQAHLARHDALTGLANRLALDQDLPRTLARARRAGHHVAVGVLDLDDFKPVNDTFGHAAGDLLLQELARRLQAELRGTDMIARLGGDEFVLVIDELAPGRVRQDLGALLARLHQAVESAFVLSPEARAEVGMSMGVALFPGDGDDADALLRQADAALYAAKAAKAGRTSWWLLAGEQADGGQEEAIPGYGPAAAEILRRVGGDLLPGEEEFLQEFYQRVRRDPAGAATIGLLTDEEFASLREQQRRHLRRLLDPDLSRDEHDRLGLHVGRVHGIIGVDGGAVMAALNQYATALQRASQALPLRLEARVKLQAVLQERLAAELQSTQRGGIEVEHERQAHLAAMEMQIESWEAAGQLPRQVVDHLTRLDGIVGASCGRPDANNRFVVEFAAGNAADYVQALGSLAADADATLGEASPCAAQRAWRSGAIASEQRPNAAEPFASAARAFGVRSVAAIPLPDRNGHVHQVLTLYGRYPGQFEAPGMRLWLESIMHQLTPAFQRLLAGQTQQPIPAAERAHLHALLHGGGLRMDVQPLINLVSGQPDKVEALARLVDGDRVLLPWQFLDAFGNHELRILFRKGLEQTLGWLKTWDAAGHVVDACVNLPPALLLDPDCPAWIADALATAGLAHNRLYLELLETHEDGLDEARRDDAIGMISRMGVRVIMDDLGSGYSSLRRMRSLPFHTVKIDQQIVRQAHEDPERTVAFIGALTRMAQGLGMQVTMEGLESIDLIEMALALGVERGQGYGLARPMPAAAFAAWLGAWSWNHDPARPTTVLGRRALLYSRDVAPLDWQRMISSHQQYCAALSRSVRGEGAPMQWRLVRRDDACLLGRWMQRQSQTIWPEAQPLFSTAQELHTEFHRKAGELLRRAQEDGEVDAVLAELAGGGLGRASDRLVRALHELSWVMSPDASAPAGAVQDPAPVPG